MNTLVIFRFLINVNALQVFEWNILESKENLYREQIVDLMFTYTRYRLGWGGSDIVLYNKEPPVPCMCEQRFVEIPLHEF